MYFCASPMSDSVFSPPPLPQGLLRGHSGVDYLPPTDTDDSHFCLTRCLCRSTAQLDGRKFNVTEVLKFTL